MIEKQEIERKAAELDLHIANIERDYVFGWLLKLIYENEYLSNLLILKGGNCLRKVYFPDTRFSGDLDFSTQSELNLSRVLGEINKVCLQAQERCGVSFEVDRNRFREDRIIDSGKKLYKGKVYFKDFYGNADHITISVRLDITEFDKIYLDPVTKKLLHPYSDVEDCSGTVRCLALEELLASKLKCLIQRRHTHDLYDFVYATFVEPPQELRRDLVASTFLRKTIFEPSPGAAKEILLGIPFAYFKGIWTKYIACPVQSRLDFETVERGFIEVIESIFAPFGLGRGTDAFVPVQYRNPIMEAGIERKLLRLIYDGKEKIVEPYSLAFKRRQDGRAYEYFYVHDRTGGHSGPGTKSFLPYKIQGVEKMDESFEPRFEIELSKAGEAGTKGYFGGSTRFSGRRKSRGRQRRSASLGYGWDEKQHKVQCSYCGKIFKRKSPSTVIRPHKTKDGWPCQGRKGYRVY